MAVRIIFIVLFLVGAIAAPLGAQTYPNKPIRLVLPFPPGGATDILGRIVGQALAERLGQPVVPENRPGSGSNIGIEIVAKAKPDGYTLLLAATPLAISPSLYKKLNFDTIKDLAPISLVGQIPNLFVVRPALPVKSMKEFVAHAKAHPGKVNYGSSGIGAPPHLAGELLKSLAKIDIVHVPYKGANQAMIGLMSGEVDMVVIGTPAALPQIQAEKVRALAVLHDERLPSLPNVPTAREAGVDHFVVTSWYGILAPAGTPREIITRLNTEWAKIAALPDIKDKMEKAGVDPLSTTPEKFAEFIKAETVRWGKVIRDANVTID